MYVLRCSVSFQVAIFEPTRFDIFLFKVQICILASDNASKLVIILRHLCLTANTFYSIGPWTPPDIRSLWSMTSAQTSHRLKLHRKQANRLPGPLRTGTPRRGHSRPEQTNVELGASVLVSGQIRSLLLQWRHRSLASGVRSVARSPRCWVRMLKTF